MAEIAGLKLIVPSSVAGSGVSVSASGKVTFTAATTISVNGVFSSTYDNYLIVIRHSSSGNPGIDMRLRLSGTDASGSNYAWQRLTAENTTVAGARSTSQTQVKVGYSSSTARSGDHIYVYGPALAQPTATRNVNVRGLNSASIADIAGTHSLSTAYDGFTLLGDAGTVDITGALTVYGLAQ
jgi:hypothetical protein